MYLVIFKKWLKLKNWVLKDPGISLALRLALGRIAAVARVPGSRKAESTVGAGRWERVALQ